MEVKPHVMYNTIENLPFFHFWTKNETPCGPNKWMGGAKIGVRGGGNGKGSVKTTQRGNSMGVAKPHVMY